MELTLNKYEEALKEKWVKKVTYKKIGEKTTICVITLGNGFEIVGHSACVDKDMYNREIGEHYALVKALSNLSELNGFYEQMKVE